MYQPIFCLCVNINVLFINVLLLHGILSNQPCCKFVHGLVCDIIYIIFAFVFMFLFLYVMFFHRSCNDISVLSESAGLMTSQYYMLVVILCVGAILE